MSGSGKWRKAQTATGKLSNEMSAQKIEQGSEKRKGYEIPKGRGAHPLDTGGHQDNQVRQSEGEGRGERDKQRQRERESREKPTQKEKGEAGRETI